MGPPLEPAGPYLARLGSEWAQALTWLVQMGIVKCMPGPCEPWSKHNDAREPYRVAGVNTALNYQSANQKCQLKPRRPMKSAPMGVGRILMTGPTSRNTPP